MTQSDSPATLSLWRHPAFLRYLYVRVAASVAVAILAVASFTGHLTPNLLLAMAFVVGTGRAFEQPSVQTVLPNVVPARILPNAVAASTSGSQTAVVAGPALGGILISLSPTLVFTVCAVIWFTAGLAMITVAMERTATTRPVLDLKTLFSGVAFIIHQKVVLGAIVLDMVAVLFGSVMALLPIF